MDNCLIPTLSPFVFNIIYLRHIVNLSECPWKKDIRVIDD